MLERETLTRRRFVQSAGAATLLSAAGGTHASEPALDTIKVVCGFPPGSSVDVTCRRVADRLQQDGFARASVVENKTGAGGQLAVQFVSTQPADGRTLLLTPMSMLGTYRHTYKKLPYDPANDVVPVSQACTLEFALAVGPAVPDSVTNVAEYLAWCKKDTSRASFGGPAAGASPHFIGVLLGRTAGVEFTHVAYRGTQPALQDVIGGQLPAAIGPVGDVMRFKGQPKYRVLATTGASRSRFVPEVPTLVEQGYKDFVFDEWYGYFLPRGATVDIVQRANAAVSAAVAHSETVKGFGIIGLEAKSSSPAQLAALLKRDTERWGPIVKSVGFTADS